MTAAEMFRAGAQPVSLADIFGATSDEFWYWCLTEGYRTEAWLRAILPAFPAEAIQRQFTGRAGDPALEQAFGFYQVCKQELAGRGLALQPGGRLLDFGCGWGRITRFWLKDVHPENLLGADVSPEAIALCHASDFPCRFVRLPGLPPAELPADSVDIVVSYSMFSRLPEASALAWMQELHRILKPGGMMLATTRPREAILDFQKLRAAGNVPEYALGSAAAFADVAAALQAYDAGKFCFDALDRDPNIPGQYGEALIPLAYAQAEYGRFFNDIRLIDFKQHYRFDQNLLILHKPDRGGGHTGSATRGDGQGRQPAQAELPWTGERLVPSLTGQIAVEHLHRYAVAAVLAADKVVLDLACGEGYGSALLAERARFVYGIDISAEAVAHAGRKYAGNNLKFLAGRAEAIPLPDACLDLAVSFETIEHVQEPATFLNELKRCLKPGGVLIISSPDKIPYNAVNIEPNPFHIHEYGHEEFLELLRVRFARVLAGRQKYMQGSHFAPDAPEPGTVAGTFKGDYRQTAFFPGVADGLYSLAVCSDSDLPVVPFGVFDAGSLAAAPGTALENPAWQERLLDLSRGLRLQSNLIAALQRFQYLAEDAGRRRLEESQRRAGEWESRHAETRRLSAEMEKQKEQLVLRVRELEQHLNAAQDHSLLLERQAAQNADRIRELEAASADADRQSEQARLIQQVQQQRLERLRALLAKAHGRIQDARFALTRLQHVLPACKQTLARRLWRLASAAKAGGSFPARLFSGMFIYLWRQRRSRPSLAAMIEASGLFDAEYYLRQFTDPQAAKIDPIRHYLRFGADEGKNPNPYFDSAFYCSRHPEIALAGMNPLVHFLACGEAAHTDPGPRFDTVFYLENYPDVVAAGIPAFRHFWLYGQKEGRLPKAMSHPPTQPSHPEPVRAPKKPEAQIAQDQAKTAETAETAPRFRRQAGGWPVSAEPRPGHPRLLAFYLPQYHPIPENDEWWGKGFTEWENVAQARPWFPGHYQPHLPADLGFYDLRVPEAREQQADMAKAFGLHGFCYYYYWFNGRRLLQRPLDEVLASGRPDFPFCICWANENWTRNWDGEDQHILLEQKHTPESDEAFIHDVLPILQDPRYIHYAGKPALLVYRVDKLPDPKATAARWRAACAQAGLAGLHLCAVETAGFGDPRARGFDALVEFPPNTFAGTNIAASLPGLDPKFRGRIIDYREIMRHSLETPEPEFIYHRGVMTAWDNTPRRKRHSTLFREASPENYEAWLRALIAQSRSRPEPDSLIFINAWNEWAEGAHLEPDLKYGYAFLESTDRAQRIREQAAGEKNAAALLGQGAPEAAGEPGQGLLLVIHDAYCHGAQFIGLAVARTLAERYRLRPFILLKKGGDLEAEFAKYGEVFNLAAETGRHASEPSALEHLVRRLEHAGVRAGLCNTVVTGDIAAYLKQRGFRVVSLVHELPTLITAYGYQGLAEQMALNSDVLVFPSRFVQQAFCEAFPHLSGKMLIRPQGIVKPNPYLGRQDAAKRELEKRHGLGAGARIILNCGYADMRKGPDVFLTVAKKVIGDMPRENVHFVWVGGVPPEWSAWIAHDIEKSGLSGRVHLVGFQKDDALYTAAADVFALTSREDPFPNVNLSAMEAGVPVVAFADSGGAPEVLADGSGVVVPYLDVQAMSREICGLLQDPARCKCIGQLAAEKVGRQFGFKDYVGCLLKQMELADKRMKKNFANDPKNG